MADTNINSINPGVFFLEQLSIVFLVRGSSIFNPSCSMVMRAECFWIHDSVTIASLYNLYNNLFKISRNDKTLQTILDALQKHKNGFIKVTAIASRKS